MVKTASAVQSMSNLYLFIGHPRHFFVQALHSALHPHENLALTMRLDSKLLNPQNNYQAYILDGDFLSDSPSVIRSIRRENPEARILVIAKNPHWELVREVLRAGAMDMVAAPQSAAMTRQILEALSVSPLPSNCRA